MSASYAQKEEEIEILKERSERFNVCKNIAEETCVGVSFYFCKGQPKVARAEAALRSRDRAAQVPHLR